MINRIHRKDLNNDNFINHKNDQNNRKNKNNQIEFLKTLKKKLEEDNKKDSKKLTK